VSVKSDKQLAAHNEDDKHFAYKYTNFLELAPVCKDDLVLLPQKLSKKLGSIGPLILVYKITSNIHVLDIKSMQTYEIP